MLQQSPSQRLNQNFRILLLQHSIELGSLINLTLQYNLLRLFKFWNLTVTTCDAQDQLIFSSLFKWMLYFLKYGQCFLRGMPEPPLPWPCFIMAIFRAAAPYSRAYRCFLLVLFLALHENTNSIDNIFICRNEHCTQGREATTFEIFCIELETGESFPETPKEPIK